MSENTDPTPKPDIKPTPPESPPVTTVDAESPAAETKNEEKSEETSKSSPPAISGGIEADPMKRFLGALIDGIVIAIVVTALGNVVKLGLLSWLVTAALWLIRDSLPFLEGQSVGKKAMKTKAVKADGSSLAGDWATGATRNILFAIPLGGLVEGIIFLTRKDSDQKGTRLGDDWAKTKVISVE